MPQSARQQAEAFVIRPLLNSKPSSTDNNHFASFDDDYPFFDFFQDFASFSCDLFVYNNGSAAFVKAGEGFRKSEDPSSLYQATPGKQGTDRLNCRLAEMIL